MVMTSDFSNADVFVDVPAVLAAVDGLDGAKDWEFGDERAFR